MTMEHPWTRFVALGDSITEGYGMDPVEGVEHLPWARRVARGLAETQPRLEFLNLGRRNLRTAQIRDTQLEPAVAFAPDLVSIAAGPNDLLDPEFDPARIERELEPLYASFADSGATVFTFTYMNMPASGLFPADGARVLAERMEALHEAIRANADRFGALLVDIYADPESANPAFYSADLQHANARGQAFVAERVLAALEAHLAGEAARAA